MKKGKQMYITYQRKGETGKEYTGDEADIDKEAAELAWPNLGTFFARFKDHPSLGPGSSEDSAITPAISNEEVVVTAPEEADTLTPSRCPSRASSKSVMDESHDDCDNDDDLTYDDIDDDTPGPSKNAKQQTSVAVSRIPKKRASQANSAAFIAAFRDIQESSQQRQIEHEKKMQQDAIMFQQRLEQDRLKFETDLAIKMQQQSNQFHVNLMQQNQLFQAELFKKLFEKDNQ